MTPELQKYYERRLSMMGDEAWNDLMEDVRVMEAATNNLSAIPDYETLQYRKGELSMMRWLLSLKQVSEESYNQLQGEE